MKTPTKISIITIVLGAAAFYFGKILWPVDPVLDIDKVHGIMLDAVYLIEAVLFGFGVAIFYYGWPVIRRSEKRKNKTKLAFISLCWLLISWWPHDLAHSHNGFSIRGLVLIEYSFHLTVIIATLLIVNYIYATATSSD